MVSNPDKQITDTETLYALRQAHLELKRDYAALEQRVRELERRLEPIEEAWNGYLISKAFWPSYFMTAIKRCMELK